MGRKRRAQQGEAQGEVPQITADGKPYEVPAEGSLSLLALGHVGLMAWREARRRKAGPRTHTPRSR